MYCREGAVLQLLAEKPLFLAETPVGPQRDVARGKSAGLENPALAEVGGNFTADASRLPEGIPRFIGQVAPPRRSPPSKTASPKSSTSGLFAQAMSNAII